MNQNKPATPEIRTLAQKAGAMKPYATKAEAIELLSPEEIEELIQKNPWEALKHGKHILSPKQFGQAVRLAPVMALAGLHQELDDTLFNQCAAKSPWTALTHAPLRVNQTILLDLIQANPKKIVQRMETNPEFAKRVFSLPGKHRLQKEAARIIAQSI